MEVFCIDYQRLNALTENGVFPQPNISEILQCLAGSSIFSTTGRLRWVWRVRPKPPSLPHQAPITLRLCPLALKMPLRPFRGWWRLSRPTCVAIVVWCIWKSLNSSFIYIWCRFIFIWCLTVFSRLDSAWRKSNSLGTLWTLPVSQQSQRKSSTCLFCYRFSLVCLNFLN